MVDERSNDRCVAVNKHLTRSDCAILQPWDGTQQQSGSDPRIQGPPAVLDESRTTWRSVGSCVEDEVSEQMSELLTRHSCRIDLAVPPYKGAAEVAY
jgi:hypothetical protein